MLLHVLNMKRAVYGFMYCIWYVPLITESHTHNNNCVSIHEYYLVTKCKLLSTRGTMCSVDTKKKGLTHIRTLKWLKWKLLLSLRWLPELFEDELCSELTLLDTYHIHSNLWKILITGTQNLFALIF